MVNRRESPTRPAGQEKNFKISMLETGARWLQDTSPLKHFDVFMVGLHCAKHEPSMQMEAHHYCKLVNGEMLECAIFDGNTEDANLIGIEYIITEQLFDRLPEAERACWHPHNYEILSGQLTAPGLPKKAEHEFLAQFVNSYGKTWHTWHTGRHDGQDSGDALPLGEPKLMWSFNRDGEADESLKQNMLDALGLDEAAQRADRQDLLELAHPQHGVDALKGSFPNASPTPPPGVRDLEAASEDTRPHPGH